ncbi:hypothetical protein, partial [Roseibium sp. RKSG952]|uniref:hypothetical protein n=1 Tax=Roseibium sp. RKSG952 TaxID=2529384 RepID=UPI0018AD2603
IIIKRINLLEIGRIRRTKSNREYSSIQLFFSSDYYNDSFDGNGFKRLTKNDIIDNKTYTEITKCNGDVGYSREATSYFFLANADAADEVVNNIKEYKNQCELNNEK